MPEEKMKKLGKFNLISEATCNLNCDCGWNLHVGGENLEDLKKIKKFLETLK